MTALEVNIWGQMVGVLLWDEKQERCLFEYAKPFIKKGLELSPLMLPLSPKIKQIESDEDSLTMSGYKGLPLFISDSLPDTFGTQLLRKYLEKEGKKLSDLNPLEKLAYIGNRGMGALEYKPTLLAVNKKLALNIEQLNQISKSIIKKEAIANVDTLSNLFYVGTSAGGAQPKVLININNKTGNVFRGDTLPEGNEESWILKFNTETGQPYDTERGKIEYVYHQMANEAGIKMMPCTLFESASEQYFATQRFDRNATGKLHTQTLHAMAGMSFKLPKTFSYEQIFRVLNALQLAYADKEQLFKIMVFNVIARNVDDHTKNFSFIMQKKGNWRLAPAYDLTFSYNENYQRIAPHFLSINGKNVGINLKDLIAVSEKFSIKNPIAIINVINQSCLKFKVLAQQIGISKTTADYIASKLQTVNYKIQKVK